jgi:hypothetical protein
MMMTTAPTAVKRIGNQTLPHHPLVHAVEADDVEDLADEICAPLLPAVHSAAHQPLLAVPLLQCYTEHRVLLRPHQVLYLLKGVPVRWPGHSSFSLLRSLSLSAPPRSPPPPVQLL